MEYRGRRRSCMTLPFLTSLSSIPTLVCEMAENDTLSLRNRDVEETLSKTADFGSNEKYDTLELRNRTVTETLSPVEDLGQDKKDNEDEPDAKKQKFDTLSLRNRDVTETLSPL